MTGPEHYQEAERMLALARAKSSGRSGPFGEHSGPYSAEHPWPNIRYILDDAHIHATLTLAAATAIGAEGPDAGPWHAAAATRLS